MSVQLAINVDQPRLDYGKIAAKLREKGFDGVFAKVHEYEVLNKNLGMILCSLSDFSSTPASRYRAVAKALDNRAVPVEGSFRMIEGESNFRKEKPYMVGFVAPNRVVEAFTKERTKDFTVLSKNVLMDPEDEKIWTVQSENGKNFLCRTEDEDLTELLASVKQRSITAPKLANFMEVEAQDKDFIAYVDPIQSKVRYGYVIDDDKVLASDTKGLETINKQLIVEAVTEDADSLPKFEDLSVTAATKSELREYYKRVYKYNPDYLKKLIAEIDSHAGI